MLLLGLDFETSGLDPKVDVITEVGAVLWDTDRVCPIIIDNYLVYNGKVILSDLIKRITGIQQEDLEQYGISEFDALSRLLLLMSKADVVVAHNGKAFDSGFFNELCNRNLSDAAEVIKLPWIDTLHDVDYPAECSSKKLTYLAADHGFLNPFAHRAVFDVLTMLVVLSKYDINVVMEGASQPTITVEALVSFQNKDKARERGFRWDGTKKKWLKQMKKAKWDAEEFPFDTQEVK